VNAGPAGASADTSNMTITRPTAGAESQINRRILSTENPLKKNLASCHIESVEYLPENIRIFECKY